MIKVASKEALNRVVSNSLDIFAKKTDLPSFNVVKAETADDGFASSYKLMNGDQQVGATINIPKDIFIQSVSETPVTVTEADTPVAGYKVGDKYIDFTFSTAADGGTEKHLYLLVSDLCDEYHGDNQSIVLDTETNTFSLKLDAPNTNGLEITAEGLKLNLATTTTPGAMSAADKTRLAQCVTEDQFEGITNEEIDAMFGIAANE